MSGRKTIPRLNAAKKACCDEDRGEDADDHGVVDRKTRERHQVQGNLVSDHTCST
jgi:hypothetical protein